MYDKKADCVNISIWNYEISKVFCYTCIKSA